jgi:fatty acid desaturase
MASRRLDVKTLLLLGTMYALLGGNVALYVVHRENPIFHVLVAAVAIHFAFTVWHEAAHGNVSGRSAVNDVVGVLGMLPYMTPYFIQRWVHLEHHRRLNEPLDPNYIYTDGALLTLPFRYTRALGYAKKLLREDPRTPRQRLSDRATTLGILAVYAAAVITGHGLDVLVLWFVPVVIAKLVMDFYINYLPHRGLPPDRFRGTRIVDVAWFTPLVLQHNYHAVHHLWPTLPWHRYREIYGKKLDYLRRHEVPVEHRVFGSWQESARLERSDARAR